MLHWLSSIADYIHRVTSAVSENERLKNELLEKHGHIQALDTIVQSKETTIAGVSDETKALKAKIVELSASCKKFSDRKEQYKALAQKTTLQIEKYKRHVANQQKQIEGLISQLSYLTQQDGKFWEIPPGTVPPFVPKAEREATIISVVNLKGGVGKTTITANLSATLWNQGKRVLIIDLDHQHNLTNLVLNAPEQEQVRLAGRYVDRALTDHPQSDEAFCGVWSKIGSNDGLLVAARERLADIEEHIKAQWLLHQTSVDARYILREVLHRATVSGQFDYIVLDCPPRLSLSCINALTSSDHVIVPVLLDKTSASAIPRLLQWLKILKDKSVCPDLNLLGVIANGTHWKSKLTKKERALQANLKVECKDAWGEEVYFVKRSIPRNALFAEAAESKEFAAFEPDLDPVFKALATEIIGRIAVYESQSATATA